ncbi:Fur family ferric uptake transcriptional regulator [Arcanobacterium wilhelmae]|uniref:Fur family ferric uptake transcriptional regulator n=1 Tax=Arcanobacterium wilhelmae TaxID=1803177 RepID=A0ABT9NBB3_9ACTO|nr:Fur family transcriptional regulator [Arcanobacterium wilhelmae]MDP9800980.1 Fur family ferric uptake transcriptional regulator [Arcanobacterium wilhelmae]WFN90340.1 Fur family transcriptional regulator [Arcanobacterium wilhelmae]
MDTLFSDALHEAGLRVTKPRLSVLHELTEHPHSTADDVRRGVTARLGRVSTQAIYDVLHALTEKGILRRIEPAGSVPLYEVSNHDNHHHLVCRGCATVIDIDCAVGYAPCLTPSDDHGFVLDEAEVTFWGYCPDCQAERA